MFFGSAFNNFGVELFLSKFLRMGSKPQAMQMPHGLRLQPEHPEFSAFVFKLQANLDPKHRDRLAYVRIVSGKFVKGMKVFHSRTKRQISLAQAQALFATEREAVEEAFPGDVIGINNPSGLFSIGDALYTGAPPPPRPRPRCSRRARALTCPCTLACQATSACGSKESPCFRPKCSPISGTQIHPSTRTTARV